VAPSDSLSVNIHIVVVLGLIVFYYVAIFQVIFVLLRVAFEMVDPWPGGIAGLIWGGCFIAVLALIGQFAWHLLQGLPTLVMAKHDVVPEEAEGVLLAHNDYSELHQLVGEVADRIGGTVPDELRITHRAHCYVVEKRHLGIRERHRQILVLGLPHLEVLTVAELKVIIAHELVHFCCHDTMLRVFFFRFLESLRMACEALERSPWRWANPLYLLCRCYRHLSLLLTAPIRRAQELRADRASAAVYGSQVAVTTLLNEWLVTSQFDLAAAQSLDEDTGGTQTNVFRVFAQRWRRFTSEGRSYLAHRLAEEERRSIWSSHPTIQERITTIKKFPDRGQPNAEPARGLLKNILELEHQMHRRLLESLHGSPAMSTQSEDYF
jgi:hypothetical protein